MSLTPEQRDWLKSQIQLKDSQQLSANAPHETFPLVGSGVRGNVPTQSNVTVVQKPVNRMAILADATKRTYRGETIQDPSDFGPMQMLARNIQSGAIGGNAGQPQQVGLSPVYGPEQDLNEKYPFVAPVGQTIGFVGSMATPPLKAVGAAGKTIGGLTKLANATSKAGKFAEVAAPRVASEALKFGALDTGKAALEKGAGVTNPDGTPITYADIAKRGLEGLATGGVFGTAGAAGDKLAASIKSPVKRYLTELGTETIGFGAISQTLRTIHGVPTTKEDIVFDLFVPMAMKVSGPLFTKGLQAKGYNKPADAPIEVLREVATDALKTEPEWIKQTLSMLPENKQQEFVEAFQKPPVDAQGKPLQRLEGPELPVPSKSAMDVGTGIQTLRNLGEINGAEPVTPEAVVSKKSLKPKQPPAEPAPVTVEPTKPVVPATDAALKIGDTFTNEQGEFVVTGVLKGKGKILYKPVGDPNAKAQSMDAGVTIKENLIVQKPTETAPKVEPVKASEPATGKGVDKSVRDATATATLRGEKVVVTQKSGRDKSYDFSFSLQEYPRKSSALGNPSYLLFDQVEFLKKHSPITGEDGVLSPLDERIYESQAKAINKALGIDITKAQPDHNKAAASAGLKDLATAETPAEAAARIKAETANADDVITYDKAMLDVQRNNPSVETKELGNGILAFRDKTNGKQDWTVAQEGKAAEEMITLPNGKTVSNGSEVKVDELGEPSKPFKSAEEYYAEKRAQIRSTAPKLVQSKHVDTFVELFKTVDETAAKVRGMSLEDYLIERKQTHGDIKFVGADKKREQALSQALGRVVKGQLEWKDGVALMRAYTQGDFSTYAHELSHYYRKTYPFSVQEMDAMVKEFGAKKKVFNNRLLNEGNKNKAIRVQSRAEEVINWDAAAEERFARSFERYLKTGKAPRPELAQLFSQMKDFMREIYRKVKGGELDIKLSPKIEAVLDGMFGKDTSEFWRGEERKTLKRRETAQKNLESGWKFPLLRTHDEQGRPYQYASELAEQLQGTRYAKFRLSKTKGTPVSSYLESLSRDEERYGAKAFDNPIDLDSVLDDVVSDVRGTRARNSKRIDLPEVSDRLNQEEVEKPKKQLKRKPKAEEPPLPDDEAPFQLGDKLRESPFYLKSSRVIAQKIPNRATGEQIRKTLLNNGVKPDEIKWVLDDLFAQKGDEQITKAELLEHIAANKVVQIEDVTLGGTDKEIQGKLDKALDVVEKLSDEEYAARVEYQSALDNKEPLFSMSRASEIEGKLSAWERIKRKLNTAKNTTQSLREQLGNKTSKFSSYKSIPGGENYRELVITLPNLGGRDYTSSHWSAKNPVAHIRMDDRVDAEGNRVLFVHEMQSDWAREGREKGFANKTLQDEYNRLEKELDDWVDENEGFTYDTRPPEIVKKVDRINELRDKYDISDLDDKVPDAPFVRKWQELVAKKVVEEAASGGYDRIAWAKGEQVANMFDLRKQVNTIEWKKASTNQVEITGYKDGEAVRGLDNLLVNVADLERTVGKNIATQIKTGLDKPEFVGDKRTRYAGSISGADLAIGGEWAQSLYDAEFPSIFNKIGKRWGAKSGEASVPKTNTYTIENEDGEWFVRNTRTGNRMEFVDREKAVEFVKERQRSPIIPEATTTVNALDITPEMRRAILSEGQELFQTGGDLFKGDDAERKMPTKKLVKKSRSTVDSKAALEESLQNYTAELKRVKNVLTLQPSNAEALKKQAALNVKIADVRKQIGELDSDLFNPTEGPKNQISLLDKPAEDKATPKQSSDRSYKELSPEEIAGDGYVVEAPYDFGSFGGKNEFRWHVLNGVRVPDGYKLNGSSILLVKREKRTRNEWYHDVYRVSSIENPEYPNRPYMLVEEKYETDASFAGGNIRFKKIENDRWHNDNKQAYKRAVEEFDKINSLPTKKNQGSIFDNPQAGAVRLPVPELVKAAKWATTLPERGGKKLVKAGGWVGDRFGGSAASQLKRTPKGRELTRLLEDIDRDARVMAGEQWEMIHPQSKALKKPDIDFMMGFDDVAKGRANSLAIAENIDNPAIRAKAPQAVLNWFDSFRKVDDTQWTDADNAGVKTYRFGDLRELDMLSGHLAGEGRKLHGDKWGIKKIEHLSTKIRNIEFQIANEEYRFKDSPTRAMLELERLKLENEVAKIQLEQKANWGWGQFPMRKVKNHFPHQVTTAFKEAVRKQSGPEWDALLKRLREMTGNDEAAYNEAVEVYKNYGRLPVTRAGSFENPRLATIPDYVTVNGKRVKMLETDPFKVFATMLEGNNRRTAFVKRFGTGTAGIEMYLQEIKRENPKLGEDLKNIIFPSAQGQSVTILNKYGNIEKAVLPAIDYIGATLLSASAVPNLAVGFLPTLATHGVRQSVVALAKHLTSGHARADYREQRMLRGWYGDVLNMTTEGEHFNNKDVQQKQGVVGKTLSVAKNAPSWWLRKTLGNVDPIINGFEGIAGLHSAKAAIAAIGKGKSGFLRQGWGADEASYRRMLSEYYNFDKAMIDDMVARSKATPKGKEFEFTKDEKARILQRGSARVNASGEVVTDRPPFMHYMISKHVLFASRIAIALGRHTAWAMKEALEHGNVRPILAQIGIVGLVGGTIEDTVRNFIRDKANEAEDWTERLFMGLLNSQTLGLLGRVTEDVVNMDRFNGNPSDIFMPSYLNVADKTILGIKQAIEKESLNPIVQKAILDNAPALKIGALWGERLVRGDKSYAAHRLIRENRVAQTDDSGKKDLRGKPKLKLRARERDGVPSNTATMLLKRADPATLEALYKEAHPPKADPKKKKLTKRTYPYARP